MLSEAFFKCSRRSLLWNRRKVTQLQSFCHFQIRALAISPAQRTTNNLMRRQNKQLKDETQNKIIKEAQIGLNRHEAQFTSRNYWKSNIAPIYEIPQLLQEFKRLQSWRNDLYPIERIQFVDNIKVKLHELAQEQRIEILSHLVRLQFNLTVIPKQAETIYLLIKDILKAHVMFEMSQVVHILRCLDAICGPNIASSATAAVTDHNQQQNFTLPQSVKTAICESLNCISKQFSDTTSSSSSLHDFVDAIYL